MNQGGCRGASRLQLVEPQGGRRERGGGGEDEQEERVSAQSGVLGTAFGLSSFTWVDRHDNEVVLRCVLIV